MCVFWIAKREFMPERQRFPSVASYGFVLFYFPPPTPHPWLRKSKKTQRKGRTQHTGCAWGIFNMLLNQCPIGLFYINAALCALRLGRSDNICVKNWASCAEKKVFLSSAYLCTLLLGHKQLLVSVRRRKICKVFSWASKSERERKSVAALCLQKLEALVEGTFRTSWKGNKQGDT